jgi:hypothetical protein
MNANDNFECIEINEDNHPSREVLKKLEAQKQMIQTLQKDNTELLAKQNKPIDITEMQKVIDKFVENCDKRDADKLDDYSEISIELVDLFSNLQKQFLPKSYHDIKAYKITAKIHHDDYYYWYRTTLFEMPYFANKEFLWHELNNYKF